MIFYRVLTLLPVWMVIICLSYLMCVCHLAGCICYLHTTDCKHTRFLHVSADNGTFWGESIPQSLKKKKVSEQVGKTCRSKISTQKLGLKDFFTFLWCFPTFPRMHFHNSFRRVIKLFCRPIRVVLSCSSSHVH